MVRYYGYSSNVCHGRRQKEDQDGLIPYILEPEGSSKEYLRNWARFIQKIYEVDSLICPKCEGRMRISAFIYFDPQKGSYLIFARPVPDRDGDGYLNTSLHLPRGQSRRSSAS